MSIIDCDREYEELQDLRELVHEMADEPDNVACSQGKQKFLHYRLRAKLARKKYVGPKQVNILS